MSDDEKNELTLNLGGKPITENNGWNTDKLDTIEAISDENKIYISLTRLAYIYYSHYNFIVGLSRKIITGLVAVGLFSTPGITDTDNVNTAVYIMAGITVIVIVLEYLETNWELSKNTTLFESLNKSFTIMNNNINQTLKEDIIERPNGTLYLRKINNERNNLFEQMPSIPKKVYLMFKNDLKNGDVLDIETSKLVKMKYGKKILENNDSLSSIDSQESNEITNEEDIVINMDEQPKVIIPSNKSISKSINKEKKIKRIKKEMEKLLYEYTR